jgi:hypothetical protein
VAELRIRRSVPRRPIRSLSRCRRRSSNRSWADIERPTSGPMELACTTRPMMSAPHLTSGVDSIRPVQRLARRFRALADPVRLQPGHAPPGRPEDAPVVWATPGRRDKLGSSNRRTSSGTYVVRTVITRKRTETTRSSKTKGWSRNSYCRQLIDIVSKNPYCPTQGRATCISGWLVPLTGKRMCSYSHERGGME